VRALTGDGVPDPSPAELSFFVDTVAPASAIALQAQAPGAKVGPGERYRGSVLLGVSFSDPAPSPGGGGLRCALDPAQVPQTVDDLGACPLVTDVPGTHTLYVAAYDAAGNREKPVRSQAFEIAGPPDTAITSGPTAATW